MVLRVFRENLTSFGLEIDFFLNHDQTKFEKILNAQYIGPTALSLYIAQGRLRKTISQPSDGQRSRRGTFESSK